MDPKHLERLRRAKLEPGDAARPDIVTRVHEKGRLTARERLSLLMDPDSAVPYGTIAAADPGAAADETPWVAETGGLDAICTIDGQPAIVSTTDYSDGTMVFTQVKGGLMYEASIGGQKFNFASIQ